MAALAPYPRFRAVDDENIPLVGGFVYSYVPGTSTPKSTYTDQTLGTPNANPVVLDANGEATIYIDGDTDFVLEDSASVQRWGPIRASDGTTNRTLTGVTLAGTLTITSTAMTWSGNPTISGNVTFNNNLTVNGNTTLGNASSDLVTVNANTISFPNGVTFSGDMNLDVPKGTFTPVVLATGGTPVYTSAGYYTRVDDVVLVSIYVSVTNWGGATTGPVTITGLPITAAAITGQQSIPGFYVGSSVDINFSGVISGTTLAVKRLTGANFQASDGTVTWSASFSGFYKV